jgi:hypothetical protein
MRVVSYARGARWLAEGWKLFRVAPLVWLALVFAYWMVMTAVSFVPFVGLAAATVLVPAFSVGFMAASRSCARRRAPEIGQLFEGFRAGVAVQLALGGVYLALLAALLGATTLADEGELARWMLSGRRPADEVLQSDAFLAALLVAGALYVPVMMLYWFAPVLGAWHSMNAGKALFYSFFASLANWRAFLAYGAAAAVVTLVVPFVLLTVLVLASGGQVRLGVMALVLPMVILLLPTLFASFYASYRDVFGLEEGA